MELQILYNNLISAKNPEDVFGMGTIEDVKSVFRKLVVKAHPDKFQSVEDKKLAELTFKQLNKLYHDAEAKFKCNNYGNIPKPEVLKSVKMSSSRYSYEVNLTPKFSGCVSDIFEASIIDEIKKSVLLKISSSAENNKLLIAEANTLSQIYKIDSSLVSLFPECIDTFSLPSEEGFIKKINTFKNQDVVCLESVIQKYPNGIDPKDMAWMFKRTLLALSLCHEIGIVHGSVLPSHILLNLKNHGILLVGLTSSVKIGETIKIASKQYIDYYPSQILEKKPSTKSMDLHQLGMTMIKLLGGDIKSKTCPSSVPKEISKLLKVCTLGLDDVIALHEEFDSQIIKLWGPHKFRDFKI